MAELNPSLDLNTLTNATLLLTKEAKKEMATRIHKKLKSILIASSKEELTVDCKEAALTKLWAYLNNITIDISLNIKHNSSMFNDYQDIFFTVINSLNKELKLSKLKIEPNLFRVYCATISEANQQRDLFLSVSGLEYFGCFEGTYEP